MPQQNQQNKSKIKIKHIPAMNTLATNPPSLFTSARLPRPPSVSQSVNQSLRPSSPTMRSSPPSSTDHPPSLLHRDESPSIGHTLHSCMSFHPTAHATRGPGIKTVFHPGPECCMRACIAYNVHTSPVPPSGLPPSLRSHSFIHSVVVQALRPARKSNNPSIHPSIHPIHPIHPPGRQSLIYYV